MLKMNKVSEPRLDLKYPFSWEGLESFRYPLDDKQVPQTEISKKIGLHYYPITIAQFGLFQLQKYAETGREADLQIAKSNALWLLKNVQPWGKDSLAWVHHFTLPFYGPIAPWISGMAQGVAISFLLRMQPYLTDANITECAEKAMNVFYHPVHEQGVVTHFRDGGISFEEFPTTPQSQVLNGHMFAMIGIHDFAATFREKRAVELFDLAVTGLKNNLDLYDTGFWNLYDLHPSRRLASPMYIKVHVQLLTILSELTGEQYFLKTAKKWQTYLKRPTCRLRWGVSKTVEKIRLKL